MESLEKSLLLRVGRGSLPEENEMTREGKGDSHKKGGTAGNSMQGKAWAVPQRWERVSSLQGTEARTAGSECDEQWKCAVK